MAPAQLPPTPVPTPSLSQTTFFAPFHIPWQCGYFIAKVLHSVRGQGVDPVPLEDTYLVCEGDTLADKFHEKTEATL